VECLRDDVCFVHFATTLTEAEAGEFYASLLAADEFELLPDSVPERAVVQAEGQGRIVAVRYQLFGNANVIRVEAYPVDAGDTLGPIKGPAVLACGLFLLVFGIPWIVRNLPDGRAFPGV
jgi:hypothetical protein